MIEKDFLNQAFGRKTHTVIGMPLSLASVFRIVERYEKNIMGTLEQTKTSIKLDWSGFLKEGNGFE